MKGRPKIELIKIEMVNYAKTFEIVLSLKAVDITAIREVLIEFFKETRQCILTNLGGLTTKSWCNMEIYKVEILLLSSAVAA